MNMRVRTCWGLSMDIIKDGPYGNPLHLALLSNHQNFIPLIWEYLVVFVCFLWIFILMYYEQHITNLQAVSHMVPPTLLDKLVQIKEVFAYTFVTQCEDLRWPS